MSRKLTRLILRRLVLLKNSIFAVCHRIFTISQSSYSLQVPTVLQLVEEIDAFSKNEEESEVEQNTFV